MNTVEQVAAMAELPWYGQQEEQKAPEPDQTQQNMFALQQQIADMNAEMTRLRQTSAALMTQPTVAMPPMLPQVSFDNLPDPVVDPTGYGRELAARTQQAIQNQHIMAAYQAEQQASANGKLDALWEDFQNQYADYAGDYRRVEYAATQVANRLSRKGLDVNRYVYASSDDFFREVAAEMDDIFGSGQVEETTETEDDTRTVGIFGGMESGGRPTSGTTQEGPTSMVGEIQNWQAKHGFYA